MNKPINALSLKELQVLLEDLKQPAFRAHQITEWLYLRNAQCFDDMTNISKALRKELEVQHPLRRPLVVDSQTSRDGTHKYVLSYYDGAQVETVSIPSDGERLTVCCSTQAGCAMGCSFCATGKEGFTRNLMAGEIVDQVLSAQSFAGKRVTNVVLMGQGEPFLNYDQTLDALRILNNHKLLNIGARHITLSTCGIVPGIKRLSEEPEQFTLAVSLHAAFQNTRDSLMPGVSSFPLSQLKKSLHSYVQSTNRRVTLEYAMIEGINDQSADLEALKQFCKGLLCHINLIPLNKIAESEFQPSSEKTMRFWHTSLNRAGIETTIRNSRGGDIAGACGQLKNALKDGSNS